MGLKTILLILKACFKIPTLPWKGIGCIAHTIDLPDTRRERGNRFGARRSSGIVDTAGVTVTGILLDICSSTK